MKWIWPFLALCLVLIAKAAAVIALIVYSEIGLGPDEAQYWTWSQYLDWGYYSKPPGIAWQIWSGTQLFGNTELGVRFFSVVLSFLLSVATFFLAIACRIQPKTAFWAGVVMALTPIGLLSSFLAITDGGMVLFWTLSCIVMALSITRQQTPNYYLLGCLILCGALFKWPIYLFWGVVLAFMFVYRYLASFQVIGGIIVSLIGLAPSIYWNSFHEWATFRHVAATVAGEPDPRFIKGNIWEFLGAQAGLLSPIIFVILLFSFIFLFRKRKIIPPPLIFCGASSLVLLLLFSLLAVFQKIQGNWCSFVYPSAIVFLTWFACEKTRSGKKWLVGGVVLSIIASIFAFTIPLFQSRSLFSSAPIPYKINPFRHNVGWNRLNAVLKDVGYDPNQHFLFGDKYQTSSILSFYGPKQQRAYFLNLHGIRKNQFSFWPSMSQEQLGKTGYFVLTENSPHLENRIEELKSFYQESLQKYFQTVEFLGIYPLFDSYGKVAKGAIIYKGVGYNGLEPNNSNLY